MWPYHSATQVPAPSYSRHGDCWTVELTMKRNATNGARRLVDASVQMPQGGVVRSGPRGVAIKGETNGMS